MDYFDEKDIAKLIKMQDAEIDIYISELKESIDRHISKISKGIKPDSDLLDIQQALNKLSAVNLPDNIQEKLNNITGLYQSRIDTITEAIKQAKKTKKVFNEDDAVNIGQVIETDRITQLTTVDQTFNQFKQVVARGVLSKNLPDLDELRESLTNQLDNQMSTQVRTQLAGFQRSVHEKKADDLGLDYFLYSGSLIKTSRDFCIKRAGKVFHKSKLQEWDNGQGLPVDPYLGGYNCRHTIVFMTKDKAEDLGINDGD